VVSGVAVLLLATMARAATAPVTHVVRLESNRFVPADSRVTPGDTVRFVNGQGGPHNVQFMAESIPATAQRALNDAMKDRILPLTSPMFIVPDELYTIVVPTLPPGRYAFLCSPHWANMRGALTIAPEK
jgi:plastocyanin